MQDEELKNNKYYQEYLELKEYNEELAEIFLQGLIQDRDISIESKYTAEDIVPSKRGLSGCFIEDILENIIENIIENISTGAYNDYKITIMAPTIKESKDYYNIIDKSYINPNILVPTVLCKFIIDCVSKSFKAYEEITLNN